MACGRRALWVALTACLALHPLVADATSWVPLEQPCPLCRGQSRVWHVASAGGYVYTWPSKYELVFWPYTDEESLFTCRHCGLTLFTFDLDALPAERHAAIRAALQGVDPARLFAGDVPAPIVERLPVAARVYEAWGRDDRTWGHFHRVAAYHYAAAGMRREAAASRRRALECAERLLHQPQTAGALRREAWVASAAMRQLLDDDALALRDLAAALLVRRGPDPGEAGWHSYLFRLALQIAARNSCARALAVACVGGIGFGIAAVARHRRRARRGDG